MEGAGAGPQAMDMERVLSVSRVAVSGILQRVQSGCDDLQEAASLLAELTATSDWLAGRVGELLGGMGVDGDPALLVVPAVVSDTPLVGNLRTSLLRLDAARFALGSSGENLHSVRRELAAGVRSIPVEGAFDSLRATSPWTWWRHPLAVEWGTHLGRCLAELASAGVSLAISIELAERADARARANADSGTTTTSDLAAAASTSAECVTALRTSVAELRILSHTLARGIGHMGLDRFQLALASVPVVADSESDSDGDD